MEISVVIPAYNVQDVLKDAVTSVLHQTYIDNICEIIIINDGSQDRTQSVMEAIKDEIRDIPIVLIHKKNGGASSARNAGMKIAQGDWIALLDADDEWLPKKIEVQVKTIEAHPNIDFLGCQSDGRHLRILFKKIDALYQASVKDICIKNFPVTPAILVRKEILKEVGYFNESKKYLEDNDFCLRVCEHGNYYHLPDSLVVTGHGKAAIGEQGLSSNVKGMYQGLVENVEELRARKSISFPFYCFLRVFNYAKYIRRILITKLKKSSKH